LDDMASWRCCSCKVKGNGIRMAKSESLWFDYKSGGSNLLSLPDIIQHPLRELEFIAENDQFFNTLWIGPLGLAYLISFPAA
jgi:hypothetical protein